MGANLICPDGVKVAKPDGGDISLVFEVPEDLQRHEVIFVRVLLPMKLFFLGVGHFSLGDAGWIRKWTFLEKIYAGGCHASHAFLDRGEDCRPRGVDAFEDAPFCGP